jgi:hypothetical protein
MPWNGQQTGIHSNDNEEYPYHRQKVWVNRQLRILGHPEFIIWGVMRQRACRLSEHTIIIRNSLAKYRHVALGEALKAIASDNHEWPSRSKKQLMRRRQQVYDIYSRGIRKRFADEAKRKQEI